MPPGLRPVANSLRPIVRSAYHGINGLFFPHCPADRVKPFLSRTETALPFKEHRYTGSDETVRRRLEAFTTVPQTAYLLRYNKPCVVEPKYGWGITEDGELIDESVPYSRDIPLLPPPPVRPTRWGRKNWIELDVAVSIRYIWANYWHFLNDVLGQLSALERWGIPKDLPIIIPGNALEFPFVKGALARSPEWRDRKWLPLPAGTFVRTKELIVAKNMPVVRENFETTLDRLNVPSPDATSSDRLFVTRRTTMTRRCINFAEVEAAAEAEGFKPVQCETLTVDQQIELFSRARFVAGVHGAGFANILYRRGGPMGLLEIFPPNHIAPHYFMICNQFGYTHDAFCGTGEQGGAFSIDPVLLRDRLRRMVDNAG